MQISDIITLISLAIAILAIMNEKLRRHMLLKFHLLDYISFSVAFLLINYFAFYENFYNKGIYLTWLYFSHFSFSNPKHWSYIISILTLVYFFYKIRYAFYPFTKMGEVSNYYQRLLETQETSFLLDLIEQYHKEDIIRVINETPDYDPKKDRWWDYQFERKTRLQKIKEWWAQARRFIFSKSWLNRSEYARMVLFNTMSHPAFLLLAARLRPYVLAEIFAAFKKIKRDGFPDDLINPFLTELLVHKDFWLRKELKQSVKNSPKQPDWFFQENKILAALLEDLSVSDVNQVWQSFGETAIAEIEEERTKGYESKWFNDFTEENLLWNYTTWFSIQFFYILINEAIRKQYANSHFFLYYYDRIVKAILKTLEKFPSDDVDDRTTIYHKLMEEIVDRSLHWLEHSNKADHPGFFHDILDCIGNIIDDITKSDQYGQKRIVSILDRWLRYYCGIDENKNSENLRLKFEEKLLRPSMLTDPDDPYYSYMALAWKQFDKIPHRSMQGHGKDFDYFARLKQKVIIPLGLDSKQF